MTMNIDYFFIIKIIYEPVEFVKMFLQAFAGTPVKRKDRCKIPMFLLKIFLFTITMVSIQRLAKEKNHECTGKGF